MENNYKMRKDQLDLSAHIARCQDQIRKKSAELYQLEQSLLIVWLYGVFVAAKRGHLQESRDYYWIKKNRSYSLIIDRQKLIKAVGKTSSYFLKESLILQFEAALHSRYHILDGKLRTRSVVVKHKGQPLRVYGYRIGSSYIDQALARAFNHPLQMDFYRKTDDLTVDF